MVGRRRLAFLLGLPLVAACAASPSATPAPSPVTITLLEHQPVRSQVLESLLPTFEEDMAARGIPVKVRLEALDISDDAVFQDLLAGRYSAGQGPDVTSFPTAMVAPFADKGYLLDLTSRVAAWPDWTAHFYPVLRDRAVSPDGHIYGVPRGATVIQLFYRKDVLQQDGVSSDQPTSWADLLGRMETLRDRMNRPPILIPAGKAWGGGTFDEGFVNLALGTGSPLYDEASGRWIVRSPGLTDVFRLYGRLTSEKLLPVAALLQPDPWEPTKYQTFPDGDLAVTTQGTWGWTFDWGPTGRRPIDDLSNKVATWAFPTESGSEPFVWAAESWRWSIASTSRHPDEAWALIRWLSQGAPLAADLTAVGNLSPRDDIAGVEPYSEQTHLISEEKLIQVGRSLKPYSGIEVVRSAAAAATDDIIAGRLTADQAAEEFARQVTAALGTSKVTSLTATTP